MSGVATMIVYYVTPSAEFVADELDFDVEECLRNQVQFGFDESKVEPGDDVTYTLSAAGESLCSIGVIDRSLEILAGNSFIQIGQVFKILNQWKLQFTSRQFHDNDFCKEQIEGEPEVPPGCPKPEPDKTENEKAKDENAEADELIPVERPIVEPIFPGFGCGLTYLSDYVDSSRALNSLGVLAMSDLKMQIRPCNKRPLIWCFDQAVPAPEEDNIQDSRSVDKSVDVRKFFPETFLWKLVVIPNKGSITETVTAPDTVTEWFGNAVCMNARVGLGISDFASIITFRTFFLQLNLPYSIIKGESVHIQVLLFNYLAKGECLAFKVTLSEQTTFDITGSSEFTVCVCGQESTSVSFIITPRNIGNVEITVIAVTVDDDTVCEGTLSTVSASDGVQRILPVKPPGDPQSYTWSRFLCGDDSAHADLTLPDNYVLGSERGRVSVIGDVMGPALSNLGGLIQMPMGCGEQTIYLTGQAAIVIKYMITSGQATDADKNAANRAMSHGYQREVGLYRHPDGSYSVWGPPHQGPPGSGSNWLTSFVVRVFAISDEFIFIDPAVQAAGIAYLKSGQGTDGCFPQRGTVIHKEMQGGLGGGSAPIALTAFVLVSLMEAGVPVNDPPVVSAIGCLNVPDLTQMTTYALSISAYAYTLYAGDSSRRDAILSELDTRAIIQGGMKYWKSDTAPIPPYPWYHTPSFDVEMTSYVLLAVLGGDNPVADGLPIVRWLTSQRNALGGWSSTQDTFVGLLAMSKFAAMVLGDTVDLDINFTPPDVDFHVDQNNALVLQTANVDVPNSIDVTVTGTGCAIVQADVFYNILSDGPDEPFFDIRINVVNTNLCGRKTLRICVTYLHADGPTNMALVEVKVMTGHDIDPQSVPIPPVNAPAGTGIINKVEINQDILIVYFDKLASSSSCFKFQVTQEEIVDNPQSGYVKAFDYYDTGKSTVKELKYTMC